MRCLASRMKGELHPSKKRSSDGVRHLVPTFLLMDDSANELLCFLVWPLQRQQWALPCNCLVDALPYSHCVMRSFPMCGVKVLHPVQYEGGRGGRGEGGGGRCGSDNNLVIAQPSGGIIVIFRPQFCPRKPQKDRYGHEPVRISNTWCDGCRGAIEVQDTHI